MASCKKLKDKICFYPTPPWATRALMKVVWPQLPEAVQSHKGQTVWEPACGEGHMAEVLWEYFTSVTVSDKETYGYGLDKIDFLKSDCLAVDAHWIITNPPFDDQGEKFVLRALELAKVGVAMFFRTQWLETAGRYENVFSTYRPTIVAQFAERVPLYEARWEPDRSTATAYCWIVWLKSGTKRTELFWIPPGQRKALTKPDDRDRFTASPVTKNYRKGMAEVA